MILYTKKKNYSKFTSLLSNSLRHGDVQVIFQGLQKFKIAATDKFHNCFVDAKTQSEIIQIFRPRVQINSLTMIQQV